MDAKRPSQAGAWLSFACALHCALEPVVLPILPMAGILLPVDRTLELWLLGTSISLALWNFSRGFSVHGRSGLFAVLAAGLALMGAGLLAGHREDFHAAWEAALVAAGSLTLGMGQFWNRRLHRDCLACAEDCFASSGARRGQ